MTDYDRIERQVRRTTERAGKDYRFDDAHDPHQPLMLFFQESDEGLVLFVVFYTLACRYSQCTFFPLPGTVTLQHVDYLELMDQIDAVFAAPEVQRRASEVRKIIVSNQGSVLDETTFASTALIYLVAQCKRLLRNLDIFCFETRPEYVDDPELEFLARAMLEGHDTRLEIAIGFEAFDDHLRNEILRKGLWLEESRRHSFEDLARRLAAHEFQLKSYFMLKPAAVLTGDEAIADIHAAIDYLAEVSHKYGTQLSMHLNPTFAGVGTPLARDFEDGTFVPPTLQQLARAAQHGEGKGVPIFLGLNDEGLAVPGGSFLRPGDEPVVARLEVFNRTGDYAILREVAGSG